MTPTLRHDLTMVAVLVCAMLVGYAVGYVLRRRDGMTWNEHSHTFKRTGEA